MPKNDLDAQAALALEAMERQNAGEPYTTSVKAKRFPDGWRVVHTRTFTRDGWTLTLYISPFANRREALEYIKRGEAPTGAEGSPNG